MNLREILLNRRHEGGPRAGLTGCLLMLLACTMAACQVLPHPAGPGATPAGTDPGSAASPVAAAQRLQTSPSQPAADAAPQPEPETETETDSDQIQELLRAAEDAMANGRILSPASGSALLLYDRVLSLDPDNLAARRGLESIAEHYLDGAMEAAGRRRFEQARAMLAQARLVDPQHPGIAPTEEQIELLASARRQFITLDGTSLKARDPMLIETLRRAGMRSREAGCRAVIHARSDSEGRWIYQQMSAAPSRDDERIRANLQIAWPPGIEVLCFPHPASRQTEEQERHE